MVDWLLETNDIGVKYLVLRDLVEYEGKELMTIKKMAHTEGPIAQMLAEMEKEGYWEKPGAGCRAGIHRFKMIGMQIKGRSKRKRG